MASYRMYSLDERGRLGFGEEFEASSDRQAISVISELKPNAQQWEVWESRRLVAEGKRTQARVFR